MASATADSRLPPSLTRALRPDTCDNFCHLGRLIMALRQPHCPWPLIDLVAGRNRPTAFAQMADFVRSETLRQLFPIDK
jgi:hypothetical protein